MATDVVVTQSVSLRTKKRSYMLRLVQDGEPLSTLPLDEESFRDLVGGTPPRQLEHDSPVDKPRPPAGPVNRAPAAPAPAATSETAAKPGGRRRTLGELTGLGKNAPQETPEGGDAAGAEVVEGEDVNLAEPGDY